MEAQSTRLTTFTEAREYTNKFLAERKWSDIPEQEWRAFIANVERWADSASESEWLRLYNSTALEAAYMVLLGFDYERQHGHPTPTYDWKSGRIKEE